MAHFYGTISQSARKTRPTARGHKSTGLAVTAATWTSVVETRLFHADGKDYFVVTRRDLASGETEVIAKGEM